MKGNFIQNYHSLLVSNNLEEFEHKLSNQFFYYFGKLLPLNYSYLDWLVVKLRPIRKQPIIQWGLNSDYIKTEISFDTRTFVMLIQFLNYAQQQEFESAFTPVNSFESDVMGMTPISSMNENSSPNQGFTPLNSFENDVLGITPVDPDYQI